jgi:rhodanese-related sulfurtransferase
MNEITVQELKKLMDSGEEMVLLDCRSPESFNAEHIVSAQNLPWREAPEKAKTMIPNKDMLVVTSCSSVTCEASLNCSKQLKQLGYTNIRKFTGGLAEWLAQGFETAKSD